MRSRPHHPPGRRGRAWVCAASVLLLIEAGASATIGRAQPGPAAGAASPAAALDRAIADAKAALRDNELQVVESRYRSALLEGWLLLGSLAVEAGDLHRAKAAFDRATEVAVETRRAHTALALVRLELGEAEAALDLLREIVLSDPTDAGARRLLSRALAAVGRVDQAAQELEQLRALEPENLENLFLLAMAYLRGENPAAAEPLFDELTEKRPIPQTWVLIGRIRRDFGDYDGARRALERALEIDPRVRRAHYYLGTIALLDQGRGMFEEAMAHFEAELEVSPEDPVASLHLGIGLVESRRHEEALAQLELALRHDGAQRYAYQFLGRAYLALGRAGEAVTALRRALELAQGQEQEAPDGVNLDLTESQLGSLHYQLALALRRSGDEQAAAPHFEASKRYSARVAESSRELLARYLEDETRQTRAGNDASLLGSSPLGALSLELRNEVRSRVTTALAESYLNLGVLQIRSGRHARAAELFAQAAELDPEFPRVHYSLGVALFNAERFERAVQPLSRAFESSPSDANLRRMLALACLNSGSYERAAELLRDDRDRAANGSLQYAYGLALVRSGRAAESEEVFAELLRTNADWPELNVFLGQAHAQQDDYDSAIRFLSRAIELDPGVAEAHSTLGDIYLRQGKLAEAETELRTELRNHPTDLRALYTLAVVLDLDQQTDEALDILRSLLEEAPRMADARYLLGKILLAQGEPEAALEQLTSAASLSPGDANTRYQLGQALQKLGRTEEARAEFDRFRRLKEEQRAGGSP